MRLRAGSFAMLAMPTVPLIAPLCRSHRGSRSSVFRQTTADPCCKTAPIYRQLGIGGPRGSSMRADNTTMSGGEPPASHSPSASLVIWKNVLLAHVHSGQPNLTNRQMTVLMVVYATDHPHKVGCLAARLSLSGPVVSRALNTLQALGLIARKPDRLDGRSSIIKRTVTGTDFLDRFKNKIAESRQVEKPLDCLSTAHHAVIAHRKCARGL